MLSLELCPVEGLRFLREVGFMHKTALNKPVRDGLRDP
jgi:hypothetical protein